MTSAYSLLGNGPQKSISRVSQGLSGSFVIVAGSVCCVFVAIWQSKQVLTTVSMPLFMAANQYFRRNITLVLLIPRCPCLWAIWIILSLSDSGGIILSILRISLSAMYSSALWSKYGLRSGSVLIHLSVCMAAGSRQNWWWPWLSFSLLKTLQSLNSVTKSSVIGAWMFRVRSIDFFRSRRSRLTLMSLGFLGFGCTTIGEHQVIRRWIDRNDGKMNLYLLAVSYCFANSLKEILIAV